MKKFIFIVILITSALAVRAIEDSTRNMQVVRDIINNYKTGYVKSVNVEFQDGYFTSYDMKDTATISTASTIHGWITGCVVSGSTNEDKKGFGIFVLSLFCLFVLAWIYGEIKNRFFPDPPMPYNKRAF